MTARTRNGGPLARAAAATQIAPQEQPDRSALTGTVEVFGTRLLAAGGAHFDRILVRRCCWCGRAHLHIAFEGPLPRVERSPSCAKHRTYVVTITDVVPAAQEPKRGAA